jgi:hypothetical protein
MLRIYETYVHSVKRRKIDSTRVLCIIIRNIETLNYIHLSPQINATMIHSINPLNSHWNHQPCLMET